VLQPAIDGRECRQRGIGLFPLPVEQFDGHPRKATNLLEDPLLLRRGAFHAAGLAFPKRVSWDC
jgi:hypothetical protein